VHRLPRHLPRPGELERLVDAEQGWQRSHSAGTPNPFKDHDDDDDDRRRSSQGSQKRRKKSFLDDLFA